MRTCTAAVVHWAGFLYWGSIGAGAAKIDACEEQMRKNNMFLIGIRVVEFICSHVYTYEISVSYSQCPYFAFVSIIKSSREAQHHPNVGSCRKLLITTKSLRLYVDDFF